MKDTIASSSDKAALPSILRRFDPDMLSLHNALHCPREPLVLEWDGHTVHLSLVHDALLPAEKVHFRLCVGDEFINIACNWRTLDLLGAHPARQRSLRQVDPDLAALWLESVWLSWLEPLETFLDADIRVESVPENNAIEKGIRGHTVNQEMMLLLSPESSNEPYLVRIELSATLLIRLQPLLDRHFPRQQHSGSAITTTVTVSTGLQHLALREWRSLQPGDVVLLEQPYGDPTQAEVIVGGCYIAEARVSSEGPTLTSSLRSEGKHHASVTAPDTPLQELDQKEDSMNESSPDNTSPDQEQATGDRADLNDLPLRLTCELGRLELTLGELRELGDGSVLPLGKRPERAVDLVINGRRMGLGRLVMIGDDLGVQIERLNLDG
ncbi:type III secretion system cytoplasmic ring protein SctQ [Kushneria marisflavi]|uniref:type III secretion system cytoplasmic ring protein SctQ n=1 Tax=Kushneria marisflavi TaxID=157779 RepID=UPI000FF7565F|nr:type III secretion system cytoplasmic ring protein SctQ [Kushneria marisflavi]RKD87190.1 type III secretion system apparatus protein YscQ/HrcQ [Kushneria marisflavi]